MMLLCPFPISSPGRLFFLRMILFGFPDEVRGIWTQICPNEADRGISKYPHASFTSRMQSVPVCRVAYISGSVCTSCSDTESSLYRAHSMDKALCPEYILRGL